MTSLTDSDLRRLNNLFKYDPDTGILTRKITTSSRAIAGMEVGCKAGNGYLVCRALGQLMYVHRIAMHLILNSDFPDCFAVDHKNKNTTDNRRCNLRLLTNSENSHNRSLPGTGVYFSNRDSRWVAEIMLYGRKVVIGSSKTKEEAEAMYSNFKKSMEADLDIASELRIKELSK